ncbi:MAG: peroxiredoxin [Candidatus Woesearchaeota archaeon]|nr:peroxiredoxin [Candidatus Woesearchaeota archaeon]
MTLGAGDPAPDFSLRDKDGIKHSLDSARYTVLYFYPHDNTPGCTIESQEFTSLLEDFGMYDTQVIGISGGDDESKKTFCDKHHLSVVLLSDPDFIVAKQYSVYGTRMTQHGPVTGIKRTTFIIDHNREILRVYEDVKPEGHAAEVLELIAGMG